LNIATFGLHNDEKGGRECGMVVLMFCSLKLGGGGGRLSIF